jgi:hypothetical protein
MTTHPTTTLIAAAAITLLPSIASAQSVYTSLSNSNRYGYVLIAAEGEKQVEDMTFPEGRLYEVSTSELAKRIGKGPLVKKSELVASFEGERILGVIPIEYEKVEAFLIVREWRVEGQAPYHISIWTPSAKPEQRLRDIETDNTPQCDYLDKVSFSVGKMTWHCRNESGYVNKRSVFSPIAFETPLKALMPAASHPQQRLPQDKASGFMLKRNSEDSDEFVGIKMLEK